MVMIRCLEEFSETSWLRMDSYCRNEFPIKSISYLTTPPWSTFSLIA